MNNYKIKLNNEAESREAQDLFEQLGFKWSGDYPENGDWYSHIYAENSYCCYLSPYVWSGLADTFKELTLTQLRDLVVLHRNDVKDANWVTEGDDQIYQDSNGKSFIFREQGWDELQRHEMRQAMWEKIKPKPQPTEAEQGLISGADALRALADGKEVQCTITGKNDWTKDIYGIQPYYFLGGGVGQFQFRLKPRTITLNVEIPAPFEPKEKDIFWILSTNYKCGYVQILCYRNDEQGERLAQFGAWRTEEEIKRVVAALRGGIKG